MARLRHFPALAALSSCLAAGAALAQTGTYLFVIPVEQAATGSLPLGEVIDVTLDVPDAVRAGQLIEDGDALELRGSSGNRLTVRANARATLAADPGSSHLEPSFVVDFDEEPVGAALEALRESAGQDPAPAELGQFVAGYIDNKTYLGNFDLASRVAATRTGDCTEHAVLLAALARATGHPARVIIGVVLIETESGIQAFGHAWNEVHDGTRWQLVDATLPETEAGVVRARYLPFIALEDEGPGFALDLMRIAPVQPATITVLGSVSRDAI